MNELNSNLGEFWQLVLQVWQSSAFGLNIGRVITAIGVLLLFFVLRGIFVKTVILFLHRWVDKTDNPFDDEILEAISPPLSLFPTILGFYLALEYLGLEGVVRAAGINLVQSFIAFAIFWGLYRSVHPLGMAMSHLGKTLTKTLIEWTTRSIRVLIFFLGAATILELWGIQVGPLLAGLGLFGVAVALGAQDLFKNLIAGLMIILERRFHVGDWVKIDGVVEGTVERINFRSTTIRRFDKAPVYVPNAQFSDSAVTNFSSMTHRRIYWMIGIEYRATVDQLRQIRDSIEAYILGNKDFAQAPEVSTFVRIDSFNDSSIDIMLYCFTRTTDWGEWLEIKEELAYKITQIVEEAGAALAFPSQSIYVEALPQGLPEAFPPSQEPSGVVA